MNARPEYLKIPAMSEFNVSNHLLGNRKALDDAWERDGYWFFRGILDLSAVNRVKTAYLKVMKNVGAIDPDVDEPLHNGSNLDDYPITRHDRLNEDPLFLLDPMKEFVAEPAIHDFFMALIDDEPVWLPVTEYHALPPQQDRNRSRFNFIHRDSTTNQCVPFRICWIPLMVIDEEVGGLALTEGLHRPRPADNPPSPIPNVMPIPLEAIPENAWRRTTYRPGDLLVFDKDSPHSGLANYSQDTFRLSMDIRLMAASDRLPMMGTVVAADESSITLQGPDGRVEKYLYDEKTYCRNYENSVVSAHADIPKWFGPGSRLIVSSENGMARLIRPQR